MGLYSFLPEITLRTPANSFSSEINQEVVKRTLDNPAFLEALYLASPNLYSSALKLESLNAKNQKKVLFALAKYILRSRTRPTPFGLFSETGLLKWDTTTKVQRTNATTRKTRIAYASLQSLVPHFFTEKSYEEEIMHFPNSTIYQLSAEIRFIEVFQDTDKTHFQISSVEKNDFILKVLAKAKKGASINSLSNFLTQDSIEHEEAKSFIKNLIESQLLVSEISLPLTGAAPLDYLIDLKRPQSQYHEKLLKAKEALHLLDKEGQNSIEEYTVLKADFASEKNISFHVNKFSNFHNNKIDKFLQKAILEAAEFINQLEPSDSKDSLGEFKSKFMRRFGNSEVPLLFAMDSELGIGYQSDFDAGHSPLIDDISFVDKEDKVKEQPWSFNQKTLYKALEESQKSLEPIRLDELKLHLGSEKMNLSPSSSVIFRMVSKGTVYLEGISGSSAMNVHNRLASDLEPIEKLVQRTLKHEVRNNPNVIFAEVVHLPEAHLGDILARKVTHEYQIPVLSNSSKSSCIPLEDLSISLHENQVILKSSSKNKVVIPRLSNTHNFKNSTLPIYRFLSDLQFQDVSKKIIFDWGVLRENRSSLPRVYHKNVIVSLATWQLNSTHILKLKSSEDFYVLKKILSIPDYFNLIEGDNELFIDAGNPFLLELFLDHVSGKKEVVLKEFILKNETPIRDFKNEALSNQLVANLIREDSVFKPDLEIRKGSKPREYALVPLNEEWQYVKLYFGNTTVDNIFLDFLEPLIQELASKGIIKNWFFIRYKDPDFHIRLRFLLTSTKQLERFWSGLNQVIDTLQSKQLIWNAEVALYQPEKSRYEHLGSGKAERFFQVDSESYLDLLKSETLIDNFNFRWLFALRSVDNWLDLFGLDLGSKKSFIDHLKNTFVSEFSIGQTEKKEMDKRYRAVRENIEIILDKKFSEAETILDRRKDRLEGFDLSMLGISPEKSDALVGLVHMTMNRIITNDARFHEIFVYDFLFRQYKSRLARMT